MSMRSPGRLDMFAKVELDGCECQVVVEWKGVSGGLALALSGALFVIQRGTGRAQSITGLDQGHRETWPAQIISIESHIFQRRCASVLCVEACNAATQQRNSGHVDRGQVPEICKACRHVVLVCIFRVWHGARSNPVDSAD